MHAYLFKSLKRFYITLILKYDFHKSYGYHKIIGNKFNCWSFKASISFLVKFTTSYTKRIGGAFE